MSIFAVEPLGFPDAIVVSAPFGVYAADDVQKIQMVFIANCRDESTTTLCFFKAEPGLTFEKLHCRQAMTESIRSTS